MTTTIKGRMACLFCGCLLLIFLGLLWIRGYLPVSCLFYDLTGYYCPGCGSGRMVRAILSGNFLTAFAYNPVFFFLLPVTGLYGVFRALEWAITSTVSLGGGKKEAAFWILVMAFVWCFGVLRNLPGMEALAPGGLL